MSENKSMKTFTSIKEVFGANPASGIKLQAGMVLRNRSDDTFIVFDSYKQFSFHRITLSGSLICTPWYTTPEGSDIPAGYELLGIFDNGVISF